MENTDMLSLMNYPEYINSLLTPTITEKEIVLDLFAGCGGLSLGFEAVGYKTIGFEMDASASDTYNTNLNGKCHTIKLDTKFEYPKAEIIIGGPPCQPFSVGGNQKGIEDARDGFPIFIDAVKKLQPKVFMFENVRGLLYTNKWYFELVI
ncbi:MAG: DNA cytosine methyltransferase, partial [Sphingobacteriales bacterium]